MSARNTVKSIQDIMRLSATGGLSASAIYTGNKLPVAPRLYSETITEFDCQTL